MVDLAAWTVTGTACNDCLQPAVTLLTCWNGVAGTGRQGHRLPQLSAQGELCHFRQRPSQVGEATSPDLTTFLNGFESKDLLSANRLRLTAVIATFTWRAGSTSRQSKVHARAELQVMLAD